MIRILQVVTYMGRGGLETMLMNYYRHIDRSQLQFDFLTHRDFKADFDDEIEELGGRIYHLPALNPISGGYLKKLNTFFDEHPEYQVIHVHQDCLSSVILKVAKQHGVRVRIAHSHCANQDYNLKYLIKLLYKQYIPRYATALLACSDEAGKWMFHGAPFQVLNNAINAKEYIIDPDKRHRVRKEIGIVPTDILVGHVGRFSPQKNHVYLIDIFAEVQKRATAKLILVGQGELQDHIKEKVNRLGLSDKVIFTGLRTDVADLMQAMDVFVMPSNYEGLPVTMIEAQAAGLPCLISDKVPIECKKTDLVHQIPLSADAKIWAQAVLDQAHMQHRNTYEEIRLAGFDIVENAYRLQNYYMRAMSGESDLCLY